jgi:hypothetical protein
MLDLKTELVQSAAVAIDIIKWMLKHSYVFGLFQEEHLRSTGRTHSFSLPSITRWTAHFLSFTSLLSASRTLRSLVALHPEAFRDTAGRSAEKIQKIEEIMQQIENPDFWRRLNE